MCVVKDAAQPGGQNQVVAYLRGCLVTRPEYFLAPPGSALKWKAALLVPRLVYLSDAVCAAHTCIVDLIHTTARSWQLTNGKMASRWRMFQGAQWEEFATVSARRRKHEVRKILHVEDRGDPKFQDVANAVSLHYLIASLWQLETNACIFWVAAVEPV